MLVIPTGHGTINASGDTVLLRFAIIIGLAAPPPFLGGRYWAAGSVHADKGSLDVAVGDAQPDSPPSCGHVQDALVLRLGAGHGQVGAELLTGRLSLGVVGPLVQEVQAAPST